MYCGTRVLAALSEKGCETRSPWKMTYSALLTDARSDSVHSWTLFGWVLCTDENMVNMDVPKNRDFFFMLFKRVILTVLCLW